MGKQGRRGCVALERDERRIGGGQMEQRKPPGRSGKPTALHGWPQPAKFVPFPAQSDRPAHHCPSTTSWLTRSGKNISSCGSPRAELGPPTRFRGAPPPKGKSRKGLSLQGCDVLQSLHGNEGQERAQEQLLFAATQASHSSCPLASALSSRTCSI